MEEQLITNIDIEKLVSSNIDKVDLESIDFGKVYGDHMFVADYKEGKGWYRAKIMPFQSLSFKPSNITLNYGQSIFEGLKAYRDFKDNTNILFFRIFDNIARMAVSAQRIAIPVVPKSLFMEGINKLIDLDSSWVLKRKDISLYIRPLMFATDEFIGIRVSKTYKFIIFTCLVKPFYTKSLDVKIEDKYSRAAPGGTGWAKFGGNYGGSLYPRQLSLNEGFDELIWTDSCQHKYIEEAGTMNIAFMINNQLITCPLSDTILAGITRDSVLTLVKEKGIIVEERPISVEEIIKGIEKGIVQEAFGMGTAVTIININSITYKGKKHVLPQVTSNSLSTYLLEKLNNLRYGLEKDTYNWIYKLNV